MRKTNIVLIGMPNTGKTTVGRPLAEALHMEFVDTDQLIKEKAGKALRDIVNEEGREYFLQLQEETLLSLEVENHVISTGGSVIYNSEAMKQMGEKGLIVYLKTSLEELESRITPERRLARNNGQTFAELYAERAPLYEQYAQMVIVCDGKAAEQIAEEIKGKWNV